MTRTLHTFSENDSPAGRPAWREREPSGEGASKPEAAQPMGRLFPRQRNAPALLSWGLGGRLRVSPVTKAARGHRRAVAQRQQRRPWPGQARAQGWAPWAPWRARRLRPGVAGNGTAASSACRWPRAASGTARPPAGTTSSLRCSPGASSWGRRRRRRRLRGAGTAVSGGRGPGTAVSRDRGEPGRGERG